MNEQTPFARACEAAGGLVALARRIGRSKQAVNHYRTKGVPTGICPVIELATGVPVEELRPDVRWIRVQCDGWPNGKPLEDPTAPIADRREYDVGAPVTLPNTPLGDITKPNRKE